MKLVATLSSLSGSPYFSAPSFRLFAKNATFLASSLMVRRPSLSSSASAALLPWIWFQYLEVAMGIPEIEKYAEDIIKAAGYGYEVNIKLGEEWYETRDYDGFSLPCGYYTSLRILIGEGEGKNWWCVMYPPLCTELASESAPADDGLIDYTKEEMILISSGKYNIKFKILEDLSRVFATNG